MNILILDNYDSFTYNIVHLVTKLGYADVKVHRNDQIDIKAIDQFEKIILSPGPGLPVESGILLNLVQTYAATKSILGICLGEQAIAEVFGAKLINLPEVYHGVSSEIQVVKEDILFNGLPEKLQVGRYHSWLVDKQSFPDVLNLTAVDESGMVMAFAHSVYDVRGVQFHPESVLTPEGEKMLHNWLKS